MIQNLVNRKNNSEVEIDLPMEYLGDVALVNDSRTFRNECTKKKKPCLISFLDGRMNPNSMKQFDANFLELDKVLLGKKASHFSFVWVNGTCQVFHL